MLVVTFFKYCWYSCFSLHQKLIGQPWKSIYAQINQIKEAESSWLIIANPKNFFIGMSAQQKFTHWPVTTLRLSLYILLSVCVSKMTRKESKFMKYLCVCKHGKSSRKINIDIVATGSRGPGGSFAFWYWSFSQCFWSGVFRIWFGMLHNQIYRVCSVDSICCLRTWFTIVT